jgi:hypothetical protein
MRLSLTSRSPIFDDMIDSPEKFSAEQEAYIIEK